mmetsp:Transcript_11594/g.28111  ORF Transcript_11594/g.28111 Transcript_11594/m.28111 type:complete len:285 (+) Transcript_11594:69-923(+)
MTAVAIDLHAASGVLLLPPMSITLSTLRSSHKPSDASMRKASSRVSSWRDMSGSAMTAPGHFSFVLKSPSVREGMRSPRALLSTTCPPAPTILRISSGAVALWSVVRRTAAIRCAVSLLPSTALQSPRFATCITPPPFLSARTQTHAHAPLFSPCSRHCCSQSASVLLNPSFRASSNTASTSSSASPPLRRAASSTAAATCWGRCLDEYSAHLSPPCPSNTARRGIWPLLECLRILSLVGSERSDVRSREAILSSLACIIPLLVMNPRSALAKGGASSSSPPPS